jgi:hypothetical protein
MSFDNEIKVNETQPKYKGQKTNSPSFESNIREIVFHSNPSNPENNYPPKNIDELIDYKPSIETMKGIKYNFMEEHRNIINTYCSVYSRLLDDIFYSNLNNLKNLERYSEIYRDINQNIRENRINNEKIINHIMSKNMDTFIRSIESARKFYLDVITSYCDYFKLSDGNG